MNLQQLRYFLAVADSGSFSAAADSLRLAPPSVSEPVRRLEAEFGLALFERDRRRMRLTDSGRALLPRARHIVRAMDETSQAMTELRTLVAGIATLGLFRNADYYDLSEVVDNFLASHPGMGLRLFGQNSAEVAEAIRSGSAEAGLVVLPVPDEDLAVRPLIRDEVLYASADSSRVRQAVDLATLCSRRLVLYDAHYGAEDPTRRQLSERLQQVGLTPTPTLEVERVETALRFVDREFADSFAASSVLAALAPQLQTVSLDPPLYDTVAVVTRRGAQLSPASNALLKLAESRLCRLAFDSATIEVVDAKQDDQGRL